jgi:hypothetical protein
MKNSEEVKKGASEDDNVRDASEHEGDLNENKAGKKAKDKREKKTSVLGKRTKPDAVSKI